MNRSELFVLAEKATGKREKEYGGPGDSFNAIAELWNAYECAKGNSPGARMLLGPHDVAIRMILLKVARLATNPTHVDSWIDIAGYAACGVEIATDGKSVRRDTYAYEAVEASQAIHDLANTLGMDVDALADMHIRDLSDLLHERDMSMDFRLIDKSSQSQGAAPDAQDHFVDANKKLEPDHIPDAGKKLELPKCEDCKHSFEHRDGGGVKCAARGMGWHAESRRLNCQDCGPSGHLFEPKEAAE